MPLHYGDIVSHGTETTMHQHLVLLSLDCERMGEIVAFRAHEWTASSTLAHERTSQAHEPPSIVTPATMALFLEQGEALGGALLSAGNRRPAPLASSSTSAANTSSNNERRVVDHHLFEALFTALDGNSSLSSDSSSVPHRRSVLLVALENGSVMYANAAASASVTETATIEQSSVLTGPLQSLLSVGESIVAIETYTFVWPTDSTLSSAPSSSSANIALASSSTSDSNAIIVVGGRGSIVVVALAPLPPAAVTTTTTTTAAAAAPHKRTAHHMFEYIVQRFQVPGSTIDSAAFAGDSLFLVCRGSMSRVSLENVGSLVYANHALNNGTTTATAGGSSIVSGAALQARSFVSTVVPEPIKTDYTVALIRTVASSLSSNKHNSQRQASQQHQHQHQQQQQLQLVGVTSAGRVFFPAVRAHSEVEALAQQPVALLRQQIKSSLSSIAQISELESGTRLREQVRFDPNRSSQCISCAVLINTQCGTPTAPEPGNRSSHSPSRHCAACCH